jgi:hypothetical protein
MWCKDFGVFSDVRLGSRNPALTPSQTPTPTQRNEIQFSAASCRCCLPPQVGLSRYSGFLSARPPIPTDRVELLGAVPHEEARSVLVSPPLSVSAAELSLLPAPNSFERTGRFPSPTPQLI